MKTIQIPGVERQCSQLILGTDYYEPSIIDKISELMDAFVALGGNTIDTAHIYGGGKSEVAVGMWLSKADNRKKVNILTKGAHPRGGISRVSKEAFNEEIYCSLERLQTDYIEMWALHRDDPQVPVSVIIDALNEHIQAGRIQSIGVSNWTCERIDAANEYAAANGLIGFTFSSINLSLAKANEPWWKDAVSVNKEIMEWHGQRQLPLLSWSSQARGFFSGRFTEDDRTSNPELVRVFYNDDNWERMRRAEQLAKQKNVSTIQIALAYVLNQPFPTGALIGPQTIAEMESSFAGTNIQLSEDEVNWLDLSNS